MSSNTQRTIKYYRELGWHIGKVEQWNQFAGKYGQRKDLFGFIDLIAINGDDILAIQSCGTAFSEHDKKILEDDKIKESAKTWLKSGGRIVLIGWRKVKKKRGGKAMIWAPRIKEYLLKDFVI